MGRLFRLLAILVVVAPIGRADTPPRIITMPAAEPRAEAPAVRLSEPTR